MIKKTVLLLFAFYIHIWAQDLELNLVTKNVNNAQTALLVLNAKNIKNPKLTLMTQKKLNLNFEKNPFKQNSYFAFIPISYYEQIKKHKIIVSFFKNKTKNFKAVKLSVIQGDYKSETIKVSSKKVKPKDKKVVKRTQKEYKEAMDVYNSKSKKSYWKKDFIYPMKSKITSAFGTRRVYNNTLKSFHSGTDFQAPTGENIYAVNDGIVRIASNRFYAGNSVVIDHGQGIYTCYFHLDKINVKKGQKVKQKEILGLSGSTGRVTGPHLHFSARVHGVQVDPLQLIDTLNLLKNN